LWSGCLALALYVLIVSVHERLLLVYLASFVTTRLPAFPAHTNPTSWSSQDSTAPTASCGAALAQHGDPWEAGCSWADGEPPQQGGQQKETWHWLSSGARSGEVAQLHCKCMASAKREASQNDSSKPTHYHMHPPAPLSLPLPLQDPAFGRLLAALRATALEALGAAEQEAFRAEFAFFGGLTALSDALRRLPREQRTKVCAGRLAIQCDVMCRRRGQRGSNAIRQ